MELRRKHKDYSVATDPNSFAAEGVRCVVDAAEMEKEKKEKIHPQSSRSSYILVST